MANHHTWEKSLRWVEWYNATGSEIAAYSVMRVTGGRALFGRVILEMGQPNAYGSQYSHYVNGPIAVPSGGYGLAAIPIGAPMFALYDSSDGALSVGDRLGPRSGSYILRKDTGGFRVVDDATLGSGATTRAFVIQQPMLHFIGKTDGSLTKDSSGSISVYSGTTLGSESDTSVNVTCYNRFADLDADKWVRCAWNEYGDNWELVAAECE